MTSALAGQAVVNSADSSTTSSTSERGMGWKPNLGKNWAAVSVSR